MYSEVGDIRCSGHLILVCWTHVAFWVRGIFPRGLVTSSFLLTSRGEWVWRCGSGGWVLIRCVVVAGWGRVVVFWILVISFPW